jgi:tetratricopeptide (TPR) repeat protein
MSRKPNGSNPSGSGSDAERDGGIEEILAGYIERLNAGEPLDTSAIRREHPEIADELLEQLRLFHGIEAGCGSISGRVFGDYTLRRRLGRGGMGVVYEAWQGSMDRVVALKVLPHALAADNNSFVRFVREAKTAGQLSHPNIVGVHSTGVEEGTPWYSMEYVEGETLAQVLARLKDADIDAETPFGRKDSVIYFGQLAHAFADVADGLQHAHTKKVIHRDIKPSNLMLDREARLRILDFGLARWEGQESLTLSGDFLGTPRYMSPEQARRKKIPVDHRTDVYSLGATMYEFLCGRPPFRGKDHADTLSQIIERDPVEPRKLNARVPKDLETIVLKCLRKEPADRYGTAEALGQDLRRFVRGEVIEAKEEARWEILRRCAWRQRLRLTGAVLFVLLITMGVTLAAVLQNRQAERRLVQYQTLVEAGIDDLEVGLLTSPGELNEGETISLGILFPDDVASRSGGRKISIGRAVDSLGAAVRLLPRRPEAYVHLSRALYADRQRDEAERVLDKALQWDSGFLPAILLKAYRFREVKRHDLAEALDRVVDFAADSPWEREWLEAHRAASHGDWDRVDRLCTELLRRPGMPFAGFEKELRLKRGRVALRRGQHLRAQRDFVAVREESPGAEGPALLLAAAYYHADQPSEAAVVLEEFLNDTPSVEAAITVAGLHRHFGEVAQARKTVETIADEAARLAALVDILLAEGKPVQAVEAGETALSMGSDEPFLYEALADALFQTKRLEDAKALLEGALKRHPSDRGVDGSYQFTLYYLAAFDELIDFCAQESNQHEETTTLAWARFRKGELDRAIAECSSAIDLYPRNGAAYFLRSRCHWFRRDAEAAIADAVQLVAINPERFSGRPLRMYYSPMTRHFYQSYWERLETICAAAVLRGVARPRFLGFQALASSYKPKPDCQRALELARQAVRTAEDDGWLLSEALGYLAEVCAHCGKLAEAIRAIEQVVDFPRPWDSAAGKLHRWRAQHLPLLASCASVDAFVLSSPGHLQVDAVLEALGQASPALAKYLSVCLEEHTGRTAEAVESLTPLVADGPLRDDMAAVTRLARLHQASGQTRDALRLIEDRCLREDSGRLRPWIEWLRIATVKGELTLEEMQERLLSLQPSDGKPRPYATRDDVLWALDSLQKSSHIRINCGGKDYVDADGNTWARDRFFTCGEPYDLAQPPLKVERDRELYYSLRYFWEDFDVLPGYRIPLPCGRYSLVLRFCSTSWHEKLPHSFGIEVQGQQLRAKFSPAMEHERGVPFEVRKDDLEITEGVLEIVVTDIEQFAEVNAIEVKRLQ